MAKVAFSKLKCKVEETYKELNFNDEIITVRQYLPIQEKLGLLSRVIMESYEEDKNYLNPLKIKIITELEMVYVYTNINFTEKQKEDIAKLYDALKCSTLLNKILELIPEKDRNEIYKASIDTAEAIYKYQTSILGIMDSLKNNYNDMPNDIDLNEIKETIESLSDSPMIQSVLGLQ